MSRLDKLIIAGIFFLCFVLVLVAVGQLWLAFQLAPIQAVRP